MRAFRGCAFVAIGLVVVGACGGDDDSADTTLTPADGGLIDAAPRPKDSAPIDSGPGTFSEKENLPCDGRSAVDAFSVYVDGASGGDGVDCGTRDAPCKSVTRGVARAFELQKPKVLVGTGTYVEALTLDGGITIEGAWDVAGASWTATCGADHSSKVTIQAPDGATTTVNVTKGASVLRYLTIRSKPTAAPDESLYGLNAIGPNVKVAIDDTAIVVAAGGAGATGTPGTTIGSVAACTVASDGAKGSEGTPGADAKIGTITTAGYIAASATKGNDAFAGHNGTAAPTPAAMATTFCEPSGAGGACAATGGSTFSAAPGTIGCGGRAGGGGGLGGNGGASIGILANDALIVTYAGSVTSGAGGNGGAGGKGADGEPGTPGAIGTLTSYPTVPQGGCTGSAPCANTMVDLAQTPAGGNGGVGGRGGSGGGGAGGWSVSFVKFGGAALLAESSTVFTTGAAGKGGAPNGADGLRQQQWP